MKKNITIELPDNWIDLMEKDPQWVLKFQPSFKSLNDIKLLLSWFDENKLTKDQLNDALEEFEHSKDIRLSLMATRGSSVL